MNENRSMTFYTVFCYFFLFFMAAVIVCGGAVAGTFFLTEIVQKKPLKKSILCLSAFAGLMFWYWLLVMNTAVYVGYLREVGGTIGVSFLAFIFAHGVLGAATSVVVDGFVRLRRAVKA